MTTPSSRTDPSRIIIRASAGTGKTFRLTNQYLAQLFTGAQPEQILATTFTRKAAGEILERNMVRLAEAALDETACTELTGHLGMSDLTCERCLSMLKELTRGLHRVRICTLDSFFSQIASSFGFEMGLPPDWTIVESIDDIRIRNRAVESMLRNETTGDAVNLMHLLSKGATTRSVSELIRDTVNSLHSVFVETTAAAWSSFPQHTRLSDEQLRELLQQLESAELPSDKRFDKARATDLANARTQDWETFVAKGLAAKVAQGETTYYRKDIGDDVCDIYRRLLTHARAVLVNGIATQTEATWKLLSRFDLRYSQLKDDARVLQFDDVTRLLADIARDQDSRRLAFRMDASISHILLDEFQDTSLAQWQVIKPFAKQVTDGRRKNNSFFCVGDIKQAIYGWRGGIAEIFDAIEGELSGLTREELNQSYRSSPVIVDTVNRIFNGLKEFADSRDADSIQQWCGRFSNHSTALTNLPGYAAFETAPETDADGDRTATTLRFAAERVAELARQTPDATIGILTRRKRFVSRLIFELRRLGIAASEEGANPVADAAGVQLIMSLLQLADHPGNTAARFHVCTSPLGRALGYTDYRSHKRAADIARHLRRRLQSEGYGPVLQEWSETLAEHSGPRGRRRLSQLVDLAWRWQSHATLRTTDFLRFLEVEDIPDPTADRVRVMTIHQSKGLEFDIVVLPDLEKALVGQSKEFVVNRPSPTEPIDRVCRYRNSSVRELLPADFDKMFEDARHAEVSETLCVLYVAVTRARHALHMIIAPSTEREKKLPGTMAGLLRAALAEPGRAEPEQLLYEHGKVDWAGENQKKQGKGGGALKSGEASGTLSAIRFAAMAGGRRRGMQRTAPSRHGGPRKARLSTVLEHANLKALERGTVIHAWFEQITWLDETDPATTLGDATLLQVASDINAGESGKVLLGDFRDMLQAPDIVAALQPAAYLDPFTLPWPPAVRQSIANTENSDVRLEVCNEYPFAVVDNGDVVTGFIDRLVLVHVANRLVAADIVDFKTDAVTPSDGAVFTARTDYYGDQLESYRRVAEQLFRLPQECISARLFMLAAGKIVNV